MTQQPDEERYIGQGPEKGTSVLVESGSVLVHQPGSSLNPDL